MNDTQLLVSWIDADPSEADPSLLQRGSPWRVVVDLNEACNLHCSYCHIDALWGRESLVGRTLSLQVFIKLLRDLDEMQVLDLTLTGGEISLMSDLSDYLSGLANLEFTSSQIITNGTTLTPSLARDLKSFGLTRISISIDGLAADHDRARGIGTWHRAWRGLNYALRAGLIVNVITVLGLHNIERWYQLSPLLKAAGVRSQNVSLMCRLGRAKSAAEWMGVPQERLQDVQQTVAALCRELNDDNFFLHFNDGVLRQPGWSGEPTPIHAFQDQNPGIEAVVKVDGSVLCNRVYGARPPMGNAAQFRLKELWSQDATSEVVASIIGRSYNSGRSEEYYYYDINASPDATQPERRKTKLLKQNYRVREEPWGRIIFDRTLFSIDGLYVRRTP